MGGITRKGVRVQELLLERIETAVFPISTRQLALQLDLSWHTVQQYCLQLQLKKKIDGFETTGSYIWMRKNFLETREANGEETEKRKQGGKYEDETTMLLRKLLEQQLNQELNKEIQKLKQEITTLKQEQSTQPPEIQQREKATTAQSAVGGVNNVE